MSTQIASASRRIHHELQGVVTSAGLMHKTVKVRICNQKWNSKINKWFTDIKHFLVHDPNSSLRTGDVVGIAPGWRISRKKRHIVKRIIATFGTPAYQRQPIPTLESCIFEREEHKSVKDERRVARSRIHTHDKLNSNRKRSF